MDSLARTLMTISCVDCNAIPKVALAGRIIQEDGQCVQIMHNGLKVVAGGYHGDWMAHVIRGLRGHHEPQEEAVFYALLRHVRHNSLMVELGCFWAYYSLWYLLEIPGSEAFCVEPDPLNIDIGRRNAALNLMSPRMTFVEAWIGASACNDKRGITESSQEARTLSCLDMDATVERAGGRTIEMMHIDAQGVERDFIASMQRSIENGQVRFLVVSTHHRSISGSLDIHGECCDLIRSFGGHILVEHDVQESFSGDGLIVASFFKHDRGLSMPTITRNIRAASLFPER